MSQARQRTPHWLMREAITQYVNREEKREAFRQDTIKSGDDYRATGLHVTSVEAEALSDVGANNLGNQDESLTSSMCQKNLL